MDVQLTNLVSSAEKLLRDKRSSVPGRTGVPSEAQNAPDKTEFSSGLTSRYLKVQETLANLQEELSKEQMKLGVLDEGNTPKEDLIHILFGETPLFRELLENPNQDLNQVREQVRVKKDQLTDSIRKFEVESENVLSVGMLKSPENFRKSIEDLSAKDIRMKQLSEKTIERLIQD
ncbi:hypothetical protein ACE5IS_19140 [Leptospira wolffii]|uniref:Uncharacterized protein n=1 Tax=Leptospira wolffii TaxID=409998 RepID=A0A2M9Z9G2_9LEPT|nr:hypothetical protein [Leptospira wolffii]PJZ65017.1 hypothetical protein CH371_16095 [Leptospira wolffii]TGK58078.1 hypothetical protein EHQ32_12315 [Leptospira wolffii]TGK68757.1 hypothetical protein EHQ35_18185 [Leptospira wolffii]TGK76403.1 hypothetical protein EHQ27_04955 [Leptospira wolffii]TGL27109.1 hypothetical protein EHQ57_16165 [Leptospira wolffii]